MQQKKSFSTFFILSFVHLLYSLFHTYFHILYLVQRRKVKRRRNRLKLQLAGNAAQIWCYWKFFEFSTNICRPASRSLNQTKTWEKSFRDIFSRCVCLHWFWLRICLTFYWAIWILLPIDSYSKGRLVLWQTVTNAIYICCWKRFKI